MVREFQRGIGFAFAPIQDGLSSATRAVTSVVETIAEIDRLRQANSQLAAENERLQAENQRLLELQRENEQLSRLLQTRSSLSFATVAAQVTAREASTFRRVISIDVGTDSGIRLGDVVVGSGAALAGRVIEAGPNFARVLLISDTSSTVIGLITPSGATGEVIGQPGGTLIVVNIPSSERVGLDNQVVTAGIDLGNGIRSVFPKGLVIGRIVDVQREPNAVVQKAFLEAAADLDKLEYVLVITDYEGGLPALPTPGPSKAPGAGETSAPTTPPGATPIPLPSPSIPVR